MPRPKTVRPELAQRIVSKGGIETHQHHVALLKGCDRRVRPHPPRVGLTRPARTVPVRAGLRLGTPGWRRASIGLHPACPHLPPMAGGEKTRGTFEVTMVNRLLTSFDDQAIAL